MAPSAAGRGARLGRRPQVWRSEIAQQMQQRDAAGGHCRGSRQRTMSGGSSSRDDGSSAGSASGSRRGRGQSAMSNRSSFTPRLRRATTVATPKRVAAPPHGWATRSHHGKLEPLIPVRAARPQFTSRCQTELLPGRTHHCVAPTGAAFRVRSMERSDARATLLWAIVLGRCRCLGWFRVKRRLDSAGMLRQPRNHAAAL